MLSLLLLNLASTTALSLFVAIFFWSLYKVTYWKRHNVPFIPALPFIGNFKDILLFKRSISEKVCDFYFNKLVENKSVCGLHVLYKPALLIRDPELIKRVLLTDFDSFSNRFVLWHHYIIVCLVFRPKRIYILFSDIQMLIFIQIKLEVKRYFL